MHCGFFVTGALAAPEQLVLLFIITTTLCNY
jgi:hypothetical protein